MTKQRESVYFLSVSGRTPFMPDSSFICNLLTFSSKCYRYTSKRFCVALIKFIYYKYVYIFEGNNY